MQHTDDELFNTVIDMVQGYNRVILGIDTEMPEPPKAEILEFKRPSFIESLEKGMKWTILIITKEPRMNYTTAVFLINKDEPNRLAPRTTFKSMDKSLKVDDYVLVPTDTRP